MDDKRVMLKHFLGALAIELRVLSTLLFKHWPPEILPLRAPEQT